MKSIDSDKNRDIMDLSRNPLKNSSVLKNSEHTRNNYESLKAISTKVIVFI